MAEPSEFETWYNRINWHTGEWARPDKHLQVKEFWLRSGEQGARCLCERLADEWHLDLLEGVANRLADLEHDAFHAILTTLETSELLRTPRREDNIRWFLKALGWMEHIRADPDRQVALANLIKIYLGHHDPDIREAALYATSALTSNLALNILQGHKLVETHPEVLRSLDEEIQERSS